MIKGQLKQDLENIRKDIIENDKDMVMVVAGREGLGKSTCALNICKQFNPSFSVGDIVFSPEEFQERIKNSKPGDAVLVDEGAFNFFSRDSMTKGVKTSVKLLTGCRKYNLLIVICVPTFFILDKYIRDHRVGGLVTIYERGKFVVFGRDEISEIRKDETGKQYLPNPLYSGTYTKLWGGLWKAYLEKKDEELMKLDQEPEKEKTKEMNIADRVLLLWKTGKFTKKDIAKELGCSDRWVDKVLESEEE